MSLNTDRFLLKKNEFHIPKNAIFINGMIFVLENAFV